MSKDGYQDKTIEYKGGTNAEGNPFTHSARDTQNLFTDVVNTEMRNDELMPKIKIENNQVVEVNSDAPKETPDKDDQQLEEPVLN